MLKVLNTILLVLLLLSGCRDTPDNEVDNVSQNANFESIKVKIGKKVKELPLVVKLKNQSNKQRIWKNVNIKTQFVIGGLSDTLLFRPGLIKVDKNGMIYVLDFSDCSIKKFDVNGKYIRRFGRKGRGPGEFISPYQFDVFGNGNIVVIDMNLSKCTLFKDKDNYEINFTLPPLDVNFVQEDEVVTYQLMNPIDNPFIKKTNLTNNSIISYQNFLDTDKLANEVFGALPFLLGEIHSSDSGKIVFVPCMLNYFFIYGLDGKLKEAVSFLQYDKGLISDVAVKNIVKFPHPKDYTTRFSGTFDNLLFIVKNSLILKYDAYCLDFYSLTDGEYRNTLKLDGIKEIRDIIMTREKIYIIKENSEVEVFSYKIKD